MPSARRVLLLSALASFAACAAIVIAAYVFAVIERSTFGG